MSTTTNEALHEEERLYSFQNTDFFPVRVGDVYDEKYRVAGKLGYGTHSTVWLCEDNLSRRYVALKVFRAAQNHQSDHERRMYEMIEAGNPDHGGRPYVRSLLDSFELSSHTGQQHMCLVHPPCWLNTMQLQYRHSTRQLSETLLRSTVQCMLLALHYLHTECHVIHTDLKASNILISIDDPSILQEFDDAEKQNSSLLKINGYYPVYKSRRFREPKIYGLPVLADFGEARDGREIHDEDIQPEVYRAPEVILEHNWSYSVDIWNLGTMVWDLWHTDYLFDAVDRKTQEYSNQNHLAEMVALMGPPPLEFLRRNAVASEYFHDDGSFKKSTLVHENMTLAVRETKFEGEAKQKFLTFMYSMLRWVPEERKTALELLSDDWVAGV